MLADPARTGYVAVALPEEMPVNETIELEGKAAPRGRARARRDRGQRHVAAALHRARRHEAAGGRPRAKRWRARGRDRGLDESGLSAVRTALAAHERVKAQRAQVRRLDAGTDAPLSELPFVFESELELDHYRALSAALLSG